jgi:hypothetical protein
MSENKANKDVLMLEYHANQNYLVFEIENANLVTSLPYIDEDADPKYTDRV